MSRLWMLAILGCLYLVSANTLSAAPLHESDSAGSLSTLGRAPGENLLAEPVNMRIIERAFTAQEGKKASPGQSDVKIVVENQHTVLGGLNLAGAKRQVQRVIEDKSVALESASGNGYTKRVKEAELAWTVTRQATGDGLKLSVKFSNQAKRLRSFDVEFPIVLKGDDYRAFFPGQNDFPEWSSDSALAYGLRNGDPNYNTLSHPLCTMFSSARNAGVTIAADYNYPIQPMTFYAVRSQSGTAVLVTFIRVRLDPMGSRTITLHIVPHEGDWRCGLGYALKSWPDKFLVSKGTSKFFTHTFGGSAGLGNYYPYCFSSPELWQNYLWKDNPTRKCGLEMMGLERWNGQYMSDASAWTTAVDAKWYDINKNPDWYPKGFLDGKPAADAPYPEIVNWVESRPESMFTEILKRGGREGKFCSSYMWHKSSYDKVREFIRVSKEHGSSMFLYWNPRDVWYPYAKEHFNDLIIWHSPDYFGTDAALCNPARGSDLHKYHVEQIERMFREYPEMDGFFIDQAYGAGASLGYDDGCTVTDDGQVASDLNFSLASMTAAASKVAHKYGKFVWSNHGSETIDTVGNSDLLLIEDRYAPGMGQTASTRYAEIGGRPCVVMGGGETVHQIALCNGDWPFLIPIVTDDYSTRMKGDSAWINRLTAPMFDMFHYRTWCLEPNCLTLPEGYEGNLFRIDKEQNLLATMVAKGESFASPWTRFDLPVTIRTSDAAEVRAAYLMGTANLGCYKIPFERSGKTITVKVPRFKGSAAVLFAKKGQFLSIEWGSMAAVGGASGQNVVADNFSDEPWDWKCTAWVGQISRWYWQEIPPWSSSKEWLSVAVPSDFAHPYTQVVLAKDAPSRLPVDDGADNHFATFELFVDKPVVASIAPSRAMVMNTISNSAQGGYKPQHQPFPLHIIVGETAELTLGIVNNYSTAETFTLEVTPSGVSVSDAPASVTLQPNSWNNFRILVAGVKRGPAGVNIALKDKDGNVAASDQLPFEVFGNTLAGVDLAKVASVSLYYDIWGSTNTDGAYAKAITLNGVDAGKLEGSGGYPLWIRSVRAGLSEAAKTALKNENRIAIANPGTDFWKIRNFVLEVKLEDGTSVHIPASKGTWSSPADHPWAEGTRLSQHVNVEVGFLVQD